MLRHTLLSQQKSTITETFYSRKSFIFSPSQAIAFNKILGYRLVMNSDNIYFTNTYSYPLTPPQTQALPKDAFQSSQYSQYSRPHKSRAATACTHTADMPGTFLNPSQHQVSPNSPPLYSSEWMPVSHPTSYNPGPPNGVCCTECFSVPCFSTTTTLEAPNPVTELCHNGYDQDGLGLENMGKTRGTVKYAQYFLST